MLPKCEISSISPTFSQPGLPTCFHKKPDRLTKKAKKVRLSHKNAKKIRTLSQKKPKKTRPSHKRARSSHKKSELNSHKKQLEKADLITGKVNKQLLNTRSLKTCSSGSCSNVATTPLALRWNARFTTNGMCAKKNTIYQWREQAVIEWYRRVNSIVACCHSAKLCAHAARAFRS